jgi:hypothetical protein
MAQDALDHKVIHVHVVQVGTESAAEGVQPLPGNARFAQGGADDALFQIVDVEERAFRRGEDVPAAGIARDLGLAKRRT